jgi:hypothetical protein
MVTETEVTEFYTIIEKWEETESLSNFFSDKKITFKQRSSQSWLQDTKKSQGKFQTNMVYEVHLTNEDILCIKLMYPNLQVIKRNYQ